jgi:translation elongation factor EF-Tu-like GTPase
MGEIEQVPPAAIPRRDIEVTMTFLPTDKGGRKSPAYRGYRPQFYYDGGDWLASYEFPGAETINPGETLRAYVCFGAPDQHAGKLHVGKPFLIRDGQHIVAYGVITAILHLEEARALLNARQKV